MCNVWSNYSSKLNGTKKKAGGGGSTQEKKKRTMKHSTYKCNVCLLPFRCTILWWLDMPFSANHTFCVFKTASHISPPAMECSGACGLFNHSLLAQAGPITQLTHAWDRPSVIQIVCTTYGGPDRKETWQPLISEDLSVGQASGVSTAHAWGGGGGCWELGRRLRGSGTWVITNQLSVILKPIW